MPVIDTIEKTDMNGELQVYGLSQDHTGRWAVHAFAGPDADSLEFKWESRGVTTGYVDDNPNRPIQTPHTEETARAEFERWR